MRVAADWRLAAGVAIVAFIGSLLAWLRTPGSIVGWLFLIGGVTAATVCGWLLQSALTPDAEQALAPGTAPLEPDASWQAETPAPPRQEEKPALPRQAETPAQRHSSDPLVVAVAMSVSVVLAILGQWTLGRTHQAIPAVPLFVLAAAVAAAAAWWYWPSMPRPVLPALPVGRGRRWKRWLASAIALNAAALILFGRDFVPTVAWVLYAASALAILGAAWLLDGCPVPDLDWRREAPGLVALAVILITALALRVLWLDRLPFGLWFDEAKNGLEVLHVLSDPTYRPVFVSGDTQEPGLFLYFVAPFLRILGPTPLAVRLASALGGAMGVFAMYLLGRQMFGRWTGLIAAAILAGFGWDLTFSRIAFNSIWSVTLDALAMALLFRALRRGSWTAAALGGISLGLSLQMYYTARLMVPVLGFALLLAWLARPRQNLRGALQVALAGGVALFICASPLIEYAYQHPADFNRRTATLTVFKEVSDQHSIQPIVDNVKAHVLMFNVFGDKNGRHNLPGRPELNLVLGGLAVLGLGMSLARARRSEYGAMPAWWLAMLAGGVFSVSFEAPQSLRTIDEINVVVLLAALPLALLGESAAVALRDLVPRLSNAVRLPAVRAGVMPGPALPTIVAAIPVAGLVAWSGFLGVNGYFNVQAHDNAVFAEHSTAATFLARQVQQLPKGTDIYMSELFVGEPTIKLLAPQLKKHAPFTTSLLPLRKAVPTAIYLNDPSQVDLLRQLYPTASIQHFGSPYGGPTLLWSVVVTADEIEGIQGLSATYSSPTRGAPPVTRREPNVDVTWTQPPLAFPFTAEWRGILAAPAYGDYRIRLAGPPGAEVTIDGQSIAHGGEAVQATLARGNHTIAVRAGVKDNTPVQLAWQPPSAKEIVPIPKSALFTGSVTANGLLGSYFQNGTWTDPAAFQQIDPSIAFNFHLLPLPYPYSIEWSGQIAAPAAGLYHFGTTSIDSSQVYVDGQLVVNDHVINAYVDGQKQLSKGLHDLRIRFDAHSNGNHIEFFWQPPGRDRQLVPTSFLFPTKAVGEAQPLPALPTPAGPANAGQRTTLDSLWQVDLKTAVGPDSHVDGVAVDVNGDVYAADSGHHAVEKFDPRGKLLWTSTASAGLQEPDAVAATADGGVLVLDSQTGFIFRFSAAGDLAGRFGGPDIALYHPRGMAIGPDGDIYIADTGGRRVVRLDPNGKIKGTFGVPGSGRGSLGEPTGVAVASDGDVLAVDVAQTKVVRFAPSGGARFEWSIAKGNPSVDGPQLAAGGGGDIWSTDGSANAVVRYSADGKTATSYTSSSGQLERPSGIAAGQDYLIVSEPRSSTIEKLRLG